MLQNTQQLNETIYDVTNNNCFAHAISRCQCSRDNIPFASCIWPSVTPCHQVASPLLATSSLHRYIWRTLLYPSSSLSSLVHLVHLVPVFCAAAKPNSCCLPVSSVRGVDSSFDESLLGHYCVAVIQQPPCWETTRFFCGGIARLDFWQLLKDLFCSNIHHLIPNAPLTAFEHVRILSSHYHHHPASLPLRFIVPSYLNTASSW